MVRFILLHQPKTGGTFLRKAMENVIKRNSQHSFIYLDHEIHYDVYPFQSTDVIFAAVRDPSLHIQSLYSHSYPLNAKRDAGFAVSFANIVPRFKIKSFEEFWKRFLKREFNDLNKYVGKNSYYFHKLFQEDNSLIPTDVLRTETLSEDFIKFLQKYKLVYEARDVEVYKNEYRTKDDKHLASCARERVKANGCLVDDTMRREIHTHFPDFYSFFENEKRK